jgi:hypothetical protein
MATSSSGRSNIFEKAKTGVYPFSYSTSQQKLDFLLLFIAAILVE